MSSTDSDIPQVVLSSDTDRQAIPFPVAGQGARTHARLASENEQGEGQDEGIYSLFCLFGENSSDGRSSYERVREH